jgi:hypothetical protein
MNINFEGRTWKFDQDTITVKQGIAIHLAHGLTILDLLNGIKALDPRAIQADYWLMLQQNGITKPIADCDFDSLAFMAALGEATDAEATEELAKAEAAAQAAAAEVPTSLPPAGAASPTSATPTGTTPQSPAEPVAVPVPTVSLPSRCRGYGSSTCSTSRTWRAARPR